MMHYEHLETSTGLLSTSGLGQFRVRRIKITLGTVPRMFWNFLGAPHCPFEQRSARRPDVYCSGMRVVGASSMHPHRKRPS
jgi:hypothetical protein